MTKTEYREYIAGEQWRRRRRMFLEQESDGCCNRCHAPRWLATVVYDQDLHVHHRSYARIGNEVASDLEALCARCHELETFGKSSLREIKAIDTCGQCGRHLYYSLEGFEMCLSCQAKFNQQDESEPPAWQAFKAFSKAAVMIGMMCEGDVPEGVKALVHPLLDWLAAEYEKAKRGTNGANTNG